MTVQNIISFQNCQSEMSKVYEISSLICIAYINSKDIYFQKLLKSPMFSSKIKKWIFRGAVKPNPKDKVDSQ